MFLQNKYTKWYFNIIKNANNENRNKGTPIYYESHHIIPRCIGNDNSKQNLVLLTAKEHYICHCCLIFAVEEPFKNKMKMALYKMNSVSKLNHQRNSLNYILSRKLLSGKNHPRYGIKHSEETKEIIRKKATGRKSKYKGIKRPPHIGKILSETNKGNKYRVGVKHSEETKELISNKKKEFIKSTTKEERSKLYGNDSAKGRTWYYDPITYERFYGIAGTQPKNFIKGFKK